MQNRSAPSKISRQPVIQATIILTVTAVASHILGLVRDMVIAQQFGASAQTDAYLVANIIPGVIMVLVATAITGAFIPVFIDYRNKHGEKEAWHVASGLINGILIFLLLSTVFTVVAAPFIVPILAPGFDTGTMALAVMLTKAMSPAIVLLGMAALFTAILHAYQHFTAPAFASLLYNVGIIAGVLLLAGRFGIAGLAVGVVIGAAGQMLAQIGVMAKKRQYYSLTLDLFHPGVKKVGWLILPLLVSSGVNQLNVIIDRFLASGLAEGSISALNFAYVVMHLPWSIFATAVGTAIFPTLAEQAAESKLDLMRKTISEGVRTVWFLMVPAAMGMIVLRESIVRVLFERGAFDAVATGMTAGALMFYAFGLIAFGGNVIMLRSFYSLQDTRTPTMIVIIMVVMKIVLSLALVDYMAQNGLALATSLAATVSFLLLLFGLRRKLQSIDGRRLAVSLAKMIFASAVMGITIWIVSNLSQPFFQSPASVWQQILQLGSLILLGIIVYSGMAALLRMEEFAKVVSLMYNAIGRIRKR